MLLVFCKKRLEVFSISPPSTLQPLRLQHLSHGGFQRQVQRGQAMIVLPWVSCRHVTMSRPMTTKYHKSSASFLLLLLSELRCKSAAWLMRYSATSELPAKHAKWRGVDPAFLSDAFFKKLVANRILRCAYRFTIIQAWTPNSTDKTRVFSLVFSKWQNGNCIYLLFPMFAKMLWRSRLPFAPMSFLLDNLFIASQLLRLTKNT